MRFEIRAGGWVLIFAGLAGLSLIVFALGLVAGYDMGQHTSPEAPQEASVYPLPNPPPGSDKLATSSEDVSAQPATTKTGTAKVKTLTAAKSAASTLSMDTNSGPVGFSSPSRGGDTSPPISPSKSAAGFASAAPPVSPRHSASVPSEKYASASVPPPSRHKPFNIQIDAVMDHANAEQMAGRLQKLGYHASIVPTDIGGQTWWRVRVGPYPSQEEASTAEQELRAKYRDTYAP